MFAIWFTSNLAYFWRTDDPSANHALARSVDGYGSSSQAIEQIQRRLQYCLANHNDCKAVFSGIRPRRFLLVGESTDLTVKVIQAQNLDNGDTEPYTALSYCWGQDQVLKTTSANKADVEDGVPLSLLPKTITDAIRVTRELRIKLLWVDSLCLVQDEEDKLAEEIAKMHHYYGNAHITISAATAESCSDGFLQDHPTPHNDEEGEYRDGPYYFPVDLGVPERPSSLKLVMFNDFKRPVVDSRAWTLQEGLLSHRLVSFTSRTVRWSCRTASYGKQRHDPFRPVYYSLLAVRSVTGMLADQKLSDDVLAFEKLRVWWDIIEDYTGRVLSKESDRLPAISGIASVLSAPSTDSTERGYEVDFVAGLLVCHTLAHPLSVADSSRTETKYHPQDRFESGLLAFQLLWNLGGEGPLGFSPSPRENSQPSAYIAPSWSWASHSDAVALSMATHVYYEWFDWFCLAIWEHGLRIREICAAPTNSEAPYGALSGGSITLDGRIFRLDDGQDRIGEIQFDDGRPDSDYPGDRSGLFRLEILPEFQAEVRMNLTTAWHSIVLEPVELGGQSSNDERVYRRVGVYWTWRYSDHEPEEFSGWTERIKII